MIRILTIDINKIRHGVSHQYRFEEKRKQSLSNLLVTQHNQTDEDKATKKASVKQEELVN
jgi:hypothetical protein